MRAFMLVAASLLVWLETAEFVSAQSALKRLEELIRGNRPEAAAEPRPGGEPEASLPAPRRAADGVTEKGYLGVVADDRQDRGRGVRILEVRPGSPAELAGLKADDLVTAAGGIRVRQLDDLSSILEGMAPGDRLEFEVLRGQSSRKIEVTFGRPQGPPRGQTEEIVTPPPEAGDGAKPAEPPPPSPPAWLPELPKLLIPGPKAIPPQAAPPADGVDLESLLRRIEELERRVEELERQLRQRPQQQP